MLAVKLECGPKIFQSVLLVEWCGSVFHTDIPLRLCACGRIGLIVHVIAPSFYMYLLVSEKGVLFTRKLSETQANQTSSIPLL